MRDELKKYGDEAYKMVEYAAREIGPASSRLEQREEVSRLYVGQAQRVGTQSRHRELRVRASRVYRRIAVCRLGRHNRLRAHRACNDTCKFVRLRRTCNALRMHDVHDLYVDLACGERV